MDWSGTLYCRVLPYAILFRQHRLKPCRTRWQRSAICDWQPYARRFRVCGGVSLSDLVVVGTRFDRKTQTLAGERAGR